MKYHAIPCNTLQYNALPCNTMHRGKINAIFGDLGHCSLLFKSDPNAVYSPPNAVYWLQGSFQRSSLLPLLSFAASPPFKPVKKQYFIRVLNFELPTCKSNILSKIASSLSDLFSQPNYTPCTSNEHSPSCSLVQ